jgi:large repetitive protein
MSLYPVPLSRILPVTKDILVNETTTIDVMFKNDSTDDSKIGYKPMVDLFIQKGILASNPITNEYILVGTWVNEYDEFNVITSSGWKDSNGDAITEHIYSDSGLTVPSDPNDSGELFEWRWYVVNSPYSSYGADQPEVAIQQLSVSPNKADGAVIGTPLKIKTRPWFRYGETALDEPLNYPPIVGSVSEASITPKLLIVTKTNNKPESEVATGPNNPVTYTVKINVAEGETITDLIVTDNISDYCLFYDPDTSDDNSDLGVVTDSTARQQ